jgi:hypothetical protein
MLLKEGPSHVRTRGFLRLDALGGVVLLWWTLELVAQSGMIERVLATIWGMAFPDHWHTLSMWCKFCALSSWKCDHLRGLPRRSFLLASSSCWSPLSLGWFFALHTWNSPLLSSTWTYNTILECPMLYRFIVAAHYGYLVLKILMPTTWS